MQQYYWINPKNLLTEIDNSTFSNIQITQLLSEFSGIPLESFRLEKVNSCWYFVPMVTRMNFALFKSKNFHIDRKSNRTNLHRKRNLTSSVPAFNNLAIPSGRRRYFWSPVLRCASWDSIETVSQLINNSPRRKKERLFEIECLSP